MAVSGRKRRSRAAIDDDDEDPSPRSKQRLSLEGDDDMQDNDDDENEDDDNDNDDDYNNDDVEDAEEDDDFDYEDDKEINGSNNNNINGRRMSRSAEEVTAAMASRPSRQTNAPNKPAEAGVVKRVYMENFMCHKKLKVDLCRNVNFIHGQNGSGKSAILAAIQICLGAGARRTHRARNLKDLVRKEATGDGSTSASAKIRVTVLNMGDDAYKHDIYGDAITVERCIAIRGGYNGYKLLDQYEVEKSRSKKDLDEMLDHLNVQVDNPVAILDQEDAKKFLLGKAQDKYNFFMKATELERMDRKYASITDRVVELGESKEKMCANIQHMKDNVEELHKKFEQHEMLQKLEMKVSELSVNFSWAFYTARHNSHEQSLQSLNKVKERVNKKQAELTQAETQASTPDDEEQVKRDKLDKLAQEAEEQTQAKRELEGELKRKVAPQNAMKGELKQLKREKNNTDKALKNAKRHLEEARQQIAEQMGSAESDQARLLAALKKTEEEIAQAKEKSNELKQAKTVALRAYEEMEPAVEQSRHSVSAKQAQVSGVSNKLRDLESASNDSVAIFGRNCAKVHQMIEEARRQRRFRGKVVGPIGSYIKIEAGKEEYAKIAENAMGGGILDRFIVTNDQDREVFQGIRRRANCRQDCGIFQCEEQPRFDVPSPPVDGIETIASTLTIEDDLVFNCLVDHANIEKKALARSKEISEQKLLVTNPRDGKYAIRGGEIREVFFLPDGDRWRLTNGSLSLFANERKMRQSIGIDRSAAVEETRQELIHLEGELRELREEENKLQLEHTQHQKEWNQAKRAENQNSNKIEKLGSKIDEINSEMQTIQTNIEMDTTELEEDVEKCEQDVEEIKEKEIQLKEDIEKIDPEIEETQRKLDEVVIRSEKVLDDIRVAEEDLGHYLQEMTQRQEKLEKKRKKLEEYLAVAQQQQENADKLEQERAEALLKARTMTYKYNVRLERSAGNMSQTPISQSEITEPTDDDLEAIEPKLTEKEPEYYKVRLKKAKDKVEKERERRDLCGDDPATAFEKYSRAKHDYDSKMKQIDEITKTVGKLTRDMRDRQKLWRRFRSYLSDLTDMKFDEMLQLNNSCGEVEFDHDSNQLNLVVQKDKDNSSQTKDVKALSGGERSFTTMCLLLALGETLETPFRILDEFDVFLDPQVRKLTIEALIFVAKRLEHRQFIFITPQDLSSVTPDPMLKILKLKAPQRTQLAGGPSQQTLDFSQSQHSQ